MEAKINGAMALVAGIIALVGFTIAVLFPNAGFPMELRHIAGGFFAAGILMLITNAIIGILTKKE